MCLPTIKQNYIVLKALAEDPPTRISSLVVKIATIGEDEFGEGAVYVSNPAPLSDVLSEMAEWGDVRLEEGGFVLTEQGRRELANTEPLVFGVA
jgi:hypothetical protein